MTSITPAGGPTTTLGLDALGRPVTRTTGTSVDTYSYIGTSDTVVRIANTGGTGAVTDSISDPAGDRLGTKTGSTVAWLTPDLHGSIAAGLAQTPSSVTDAIRYDGYGQTVAVWPTGGSPATTSWKYQGRLDLSPSSIPLYAAGARDYAPGLGMFTSLDTFAGSAQDPASMNRFLYAEANPATLLDRRAHGQDGGRWRIGPHHRGGLPLPLRTDHLRHRHRPRGGQPLGGQPDLCGQRHGTGAGCPGTDL